MVKHSCALWQTSDGEFGCVVDEQVISRSDGSGELRIDRHPAVVANVLVCTGGGCSGFASSVYGPTLFLCCVVNKTGLLDLVAHDPARRSVQHLS